MKCHICISFVNDLSDACFIPCHETVSSGSFVFTELMSQIDQKITELVAEQQKIDAKRAHDKSELEQLKQDIANANKQKQLISKALANKVLLDFYIIQSYPECFFPVGSCLWIFLLLILFQLFLNACRRSHLRMSRIRSINSRLVWQ